METIDTIEIEMSPSPPPFQNPMHTIQIWKRIALAVVIAILALVFLGVLIGFVVLVFSYNAKMGAETKYMTFQIPTPYPAVSRRANYMNPPIFI